MTPEDAQSEWELRLEAIRFTLCKPHGRPLSLCAACWPLAADTVADGPDVVADGPDSPPADRP